RERCKSPPDGVADPHYPTNAVEWERGLERVVRELGLPATAIAGAGHVLLPTGTRADLIGAENQPD
ncbi:MAG TPA: hypothetical protein VGH93_09270, partial [Solirubrobacteraceae bacterium]